MSGRGGDGDEVVAAGREQAQDDAVGADPRRWMILGVVILAAFLTTLSITVLSVAIPAMRTDLDASVTAIQWVISGYALVFASLLMIGGRLGDLFGSRAMLAVGAGIFGLGSAIAALSTNVGWLVLGLAVLGGIGSALLSPATLALLSTTFHGSERVTAFAVWGAFIGAGAALGPVFGGYVTTNYSWRWAFLANVVLAPIVILTVLILIRREERRATRPRLDVAGSLLIGSGLFALLFAVTQGSTYGWWRPLEDLVVLDAVVWSQDRPVSIAVLALAVATIALGAFGWLETWKERLDKDPLFQFSEFRERTFRYSIIVSFLMMAAQVGVLFVLPIFLQEDQQLSAFENGLWLAPTGITSLLSAKVGVVLARRIGTTKVVRFGLLVSVAGLSMQAVLLQPGVTFWQLLGPLVVYGLGGGIVFSQLANVMLVGVPPERAGSASGANGTARQIGSAFGVAVLGAVLASGAARWGLAGAIRPTMVLGVIILAAAYGFSLRIPNLHQSGPLAQTPEPLDAVRSRPGP